MQTPLGELRECCALHQQEPRGRGSRRKPRHLLEWGRAKLFTAWQPANAPLHACTAFSILALLQWLWRRGKTGRVIAALAEPSGLREREASLRMADLHWEFRRRLPLDYSTHTCRRRSVHLTGRSTALPTGYQIASFAARIASVGNWLPLEPSPVTHRHWCAKA